MTSMTVALPLANPPSPAAALVAGVDTHKDTHHVAILDHVGRPVADREFRADGRGYAQIITFLRDHGDIDRVGVEGTGSYGAGLSRALNATGFTVVEVARHDRQARRRRGKSDPLDAHQAAVTVLAGTDTAVPKSGDGAVESLRILIGERRSAAKARAQVMNQIHALLITAPELVRQAFRALTGQRLVNTLARTRPGTGGSSDPEVISRQTLKRLAVRHLSMQAEIDIIERQLDALVRQVNPTLLSLSGVGPVTAATLLVAAGDNPERLATRATFAALTGVAPIPASSGQRTRHRLSRGGNRHANAALHRIVLLRMRHREPRTKAYFERRRAEGLTNRDVMRCLKRHISNEIYAALLNPATDNPAGRELRAQRQRIGIPISILAMTLGVPYQRLRRLEIGTRADPDLEQRATLALARLTPPPDA
ncbi:IS110 family transposase [Microbacterium aerolatum]|uniref:IS110 family transposase n=1 Tax=Microbacterium aerolatum TaxID=153731 RepID=UPI0020008B2A|nr:IS110 family transposase [Microbacterium aerolatum]MCK3771288.1 IS110 family transposase [Microbacterium aerolatum]